MTDFCTVKGLCRASRWSTAKKLQNMEMTFIFFDVHLLRCTTNISEKHKKGKSQPRHHGCHRRILSWLAILCFFSPSSMPPTSAARRRHRRHHHHLPPPVYRWTKIVRGGEGDRESAVGGRSVVAQRRDGRLVDAAVGPLLHAIGSVVGGVPQTPRPDPAVAPARATGSSHIARLRRSTPERRRRGT
jgi:hypothetical protein